MNTVRKLCDRVIVLDHGTVVFDGPTEEGIKVYLNDLQSLDKPYIDLSKKQRPKYSNNEIRMEYIKMVGKEDVVFESGEPIHFELGWTSLKDIEDLRIQLIFAYNFERSVGSSFSLPFTNAKRGENTYQNSTSTQAFSPKGNIRSRSRSII